MRLLLLGDIVGRPGRRAVIEYLGEHRERYGFVLANGENAAGGYGITPDIAAELVSAGVDVITSGNHVWKQRSMLKAMEEQDDCRVLRPANYPPGNPGSGHIELTRGGRRFLVLSLQGRVYMPTGLDCPFRVADRLLSGRVVDAVLVDFHAEATSEKIYMGRYLDGRATVVAGTHTHVQTADEAVLPGGTAYITDLGMCGPVEGVIGMRTEDAGARLLTARGHRLKIAEPPAAVRGVEVELGPDMRPTSVERLDRVV